MFDAGVSSEETWLRLGLIMIDAAGYEVVRSKKEDS